MNKILNQLFDSNRFKSENKLFRLNDKVVFSARVLIDF